MFYRMIVDGSGRWKGLCHAESQRDFQDKLWYLRSILNDRQLFFSGKTFKTPDLKNHHKIEIMPVF